MNRPLAGRSRGCHLLFAVTLTANANVLASAPDSRAPNDYFGTLSLPGSSLERIAAELLSNNLQERLRAYREIEFRNDSATWALLRTHLETANPTLSPTEQLTLARLLARHTPNPEVYRMLGHHAFSIGMTSNPNDALSRLAVETCFLAVAKKGDSQSLALLGRAISLSGLLEDSAIAALQVYPPTPLSRLLDPAIRRSDGLRRLLDQLAREPDELVPSIAPEFETLTLRANDPRRELLQRYADQTFPRELLPSLASKLRNGGSVERFCAAATIARIDLQTLTPWLIKRDPIITNALRWALPYLPNNASQFDQFAQLLFSEVLSPAEASPIAFPLTQPFLQNQVPTTTLLALAQSNTLHSQQGAEGFASRLTEENSPEIRQLLAFGTPQVRAGASLGLARANAGFATGMLIDRYAVEPEARVRRAIIFALMCRNSEWGNTWVTDAGANDPDPVIRELAGHRESISVRACLSLPPLFDPFQRDVLAALGIDPLDRRGRHRTNGPPLGDGLALRHRAATSSSEMVQVTGPLGRTVSVTPDPQGLFLIVGNPRQLTIDAWHPSTANDARASDR